MVYQLRGFAKLKKTSTNPPKNVPTHPIPIFISDIKKLLCKAHNSIECNSVGVWIEAAVVYRTHYCGSRKHQQIPVVTVLFSPCCLGCGGNSSRLWHDPFGVVLVTYYVCNTWFIAFTSYLMLMYGRCSHNIMFRLACCQPVQLPHP